MGTYLNPGNSGFAEMIRSDYVDETGLIALINNTIDTNRKLTCISRPRRFGKSYAAQMLCAYYDKTSHSHDLFAGYAISSDESYEKHINQYDVIYLDMAGIKPYTNNYRELVPFVMRTITNEIVAQYPAVKAKEDLSSTLVDAVEKIGNKFIVIIDEWDAPIRENITVQNEYLEFLRSLFKNSGTTSKIFAAAYMTGILPIKKDGSQSAISDFKEFSVIKPRQFAEYVGFTETEVQNLCSTHGIRFDQMKQWYDGYTFKGVGSVYNPNSVMQAVYYDDFDSYWTQTSAAEGLMEYISKDYNGLTKTVAELIGGVEVKLEFQKSIREVSHRETLKRLEESDRLFLDTIEGNEEAVAAQIEKVHREETAPLHYNKEASLRSVIKLAYYTYREHYLQWKELPAGVGYADIVYLPKPDSQWPALVIELKWNDSAEGAIAQILHKKYPESLKGFGRDILLVGINYDKDSREKDKKHTCKIVKV